MFVILLLLCLGLIGVVLYLKMKQKYKYFQKRGVAYIKPFFIFGSTWEALLFKENFQVHIHRMYNEYPDEKIIGLFQGMQPTYMIRDPEIVNRVMIKDFSHFHDRGIPINEETNPLEGHLFNLSGSRWKTLRNKLSPTFTSGKLKGMYFLMEKCVNSFISHLDDLQGEEVEVKEALSKLTTDVIGSCAFGIDAEGLKNPDSEFRQMSKNITTPSLPLVLKQAFLFFFPKIGIHLKLKTIPEEIHNFFTSVTKQNFEHRLKTGTKRNDFLQLLLQLREKGEVDTDPAELKDNEEDVYLKHIEDKVQDNGKLVISDELLAAQAFVFFIAGFETSASSLSFTLYFLSKNQIIQEKLRREVKEVKKKHGGISYLALKEMIYLDACIKEGLRLYPPVATLFRICNKSLPLGDGVTIEKGNLILISNGSIQRDSKYFTDPEKFNPDRFLDQTILPGTFMPFGDGPRICIGQRFALMELKMVLAKLMENYKIETCPKMEQNEPLKLNPRSFILSPIKGIFCRFVKL